MYWALNSFVHFSFQKCSIAFYLSLLVPKFQMHMLTIFMWDIPVYGEYKLVQIIVNHTQ